MNEFNSKSASPEQRLFVSVIVNAVLEAVGKGRGTPRELEQAKREARRWFATGGEDFETVCSFAGMHPDDVRSGVAAYIHAYERGEIRVPRRHEGKPPTRRLRYGVNQYDVAARAGVSQQTVSRVLSGPQELDTPATRRVREALAALTNTAPTAKAA